ncbi:putative type II secretion system protein HxcR [bacterium HR18]|nr:putative type II secretion system protein HxcR [bacterium HR18]
MSWSDLFGRRRLLREWNEELRRLKLEAEKSAKAANSDSDLKGQEAFAQHVPSGWPLAAGDGAEADLPALASEAADEALPVQASAEEAEASLLETAEAKLTSATQQAEGMPQASALDAAGDAKSFTNGQGSSSSGGEGLSPARGGSEPPSAPRNNLPEGSFAPELAEMFEDDVVLSLLYHGALRLDQIAQAIAERRQQPDQPLWRVLLNQNGVDREAIFAEAARVAGIEPAPIDETRPSVEFIRAILLLFPASVQQQLFAHGLLPCGFTANPASGQRTLLLATFDPTRSELAAVLHLLGMPAALRYAPERIIQKRLGELRLRPPESAGLSKPAGTEKRSETPLPAEPKAPEPPPSLRQLAWEIDETEPETPEPVADEPEDLDWLPPLAQDADAPASSAAAEPETPSSAEGRGPDKALPEDWEQKPLRAPSEAHPEPHAEAPALDPETIVALEAIETTPGAFEGDEEADETDSIDEAVPPPVQIVLDDLPELKEAIVRDRVVSRLVEKGAVPLHVVYQAYQRQQEEQLKEPLWRVLAQHEQAPQEAIYEEAARLYAFPIARLEPGKPSPEFVRSVMDTFEEEVRERLIDLRVIPFEVDLDAQTGAVKLVLVTHDPMRPEVHRLVQRLKLERFELQYAPRSVITAALLEAYPRRNEYLERVREEAAFDLGTSYDTETELIDEEALEAEINRSKLINLFEATLVEAVRQGASDIHIFPNNQKKVEIHFRIDGRLSRWHVEDKVHPEALIAVIKDQSVNVDRFERDAAQDGFIQRWIDDHLIRFRVSVLPIANALEDLRSESIVIRVLDDRKVIKDLRLLGLNKKALERFERAIRQPHGMVIVTGPTGSGKSTTLYAALHQVVSPEVNVLTIEDPVEYIIPGVRQIKLNHKLGLEDALRAILRHDPDIVMVGEMRDRQTAELAIKLANTGHLTFSTLHTNDAPSAVSRLYKMGIEPFLIAYAINLVVAQRLIRKVCPACKVEDKDPDYVMLRKLGFTDEEIARTTFYKAGRNRHCKVCKGVGYKGRRAIVEAMYFSRTIRHMIVEAQGAIDEDALREQAIKEGMQTLRDAAREVVLLGETTVEEMIRVTTTEE